MDYDACVAGQAYLNFDLQLERDGHGYRARVLASPGGQTAGVPFVHPFSELEVENFVLRVGNRKRGVRGGAAMTMASTAAAFGARLFEATFTGDVAGCLHRSLAVTDNDRSGLRIRLHLVDCPELADLPWEYLHDASRQRFLCLSERTPLVRYLPLPDPVRPLPVAGPVRILAVISNPEVDADVLNVEAEWDNLGVAVAGPRAAGRIMLDRLARPTLADLHRALGRHEYHVLHFIGHGRFNPALGQGELLFADDQDRALAVTGSSLATILHDHRSLRLAVLNACEGARSGTADVFAGTAQTLIRQGVPAVVAMQFEISDPAAIAFSEGFYEAIAAKRPLDAATATGRTRVYAQTNGGVEWATPVLYTRSADTTIFEIAADSDRVPPIVEKRQPTLVRERVAPARTAPDVPLLAHPARGERQGRVVSWNRSGFVTTNEEATDFVAVAVGGGHGLALHADGTVGAWGSYAIWPAALSSHPTDVVALAAAGNHSLFLNADGRVSAAGSHLFGKTNIPDRVSGIIAVAAGTTHSVVLREDGVVMAWSGKENRDPPSSLRPAVAVAAGDEVSYAMHADGTVSAWGRSAIVNLPPSLSDVRAIAVGSLFAVALHEDGRVTAWGANTHGQCDVPTGLDDVVAIAAGSTHVLALRHNGTVMAWGKLLDKPATVPAGLTGIIAIDAAYDNNVALLSAI